MIRRLAGGGIWLIEWRESSSITATHAMLREISTTRVMLQKILQHRSSCRFFFCNRGFVTIPYVFLQQRSCCNLFLQQRSHYSPFCNKDPAVGTHCSRNSLQDTCRTDDMAGARVPSASCSRNRVFRLQFQWKPTKKATTLLTWLDPNVLHSRWLNVSPLC